MYLFQNKLFNYRNIKACLYLIQHLNRSLKNPTLNYQIQSNKIELISRYINFTKYTI